MEKIAEIQYTSSPRQEFLKGITVILPILSGVIPFGMLYGAIAVASGVPSNIALAMSTVVFAGSAQFVAAKLMSGGASAMLLLFTTLVVNLRHALYGISLGAKLDYLPARWKWLLAYLLTDEAYAVTIVRTEEKDWANGKQQYTHWVFLAAGLSLWVVWQISTAVGVLFGSQIPASWQLDFALPLTFIALVIPMLCDRAGIIAALTGGVAALVFSSLPLKLGLIAAVFCGILAGMVAEYFLEGRKQKPAAGINVEQEEA
jgi:4-azaleucine resistance transporter AzlC